MNDRELNYPPDRFFNRELSWIYFNERVLEQAHDVNLPILERLKFLAIASSNLDEFFQVRVGSLHRSRGKKTRDPAGLTAAEQLAQIRERAMQLHDKLDQCLLEELEPELEKVGIVRVRPETLTAAGFRVLQQVFADEINSTICPIALPLDGEFPVSPGARLYICVRLRTDTPNAFLKNQPVTSNAEPTTSHRGEGASNVRHLVIPLPGNLTRMVVVPGDRLHHYILIEDVIGMFLDELFPQEEVEEWTTFRVTRNADFNLDDDTDDFFQEMQRLIDQRASAECVRLRMAHTTSPAMIDFLTQALKVTPDDVYLARGPLDLTVFYNLVNNPRFADFREQPWVPVPDPDFDEPTNIFERIADRDRVLFHPYQSFDPVVELLQQAAKDPNVLAIKQTLYRTSRFSKIVKALGEASENGKIVTAVVELKARFDEERNMDWSEQLQRQGVDVVYGVAGFKVHAKLCIIVRREPTGIRRYVHFGTGNYNESTSTLYSDISYLTCDPQLGLDAIHAFNSITGLSTPQEMQKLALAPIDLRETLKGLIELEIINAEKKQRAEITGKLNSLVDPEMIDLLYRASQVGVKIRLNVRGICCLKPGVPGLSDNIRVVSIVDRFLEHSRAWVFHHGGEKQVFITSADWMGRNLDRRVELLVPIDEETCRQRVLEVLDAYFNDNVNAWEIQADGSHRRLKPKRATPFRSQQFLIDYFRELSEKGENPRSMVFRAIRGKEV